MELDHDFTVPVPVEQAWAVLLDVERVAQCMPGAILDSVNGEEYAGRMKVKVGAMTITYRGTARIVSADETSRTVTLEAAAKEARGSGTASATVQARLHDEDGTTRVTVHTKLNVTGRPAQFGRNILSEVGSKIINRFAKALATELQSPTPETKPTPSTPEQPITPNGPTAESTAADLVPSPKPEAPAARKDPAEPEAQADASTESAEPHPPEPAAAEIAEPTPAVPHQRPAGPSERPLRSVPTASQQDNDAIDLLEVAGPSLAKRAVPAVGALFAFLLAVRYLTRRRKHR
ncbi:SRPBCC family protein [Actinomadura rubrisoli]|uniref:Carbon monoxide dehydrogenase n=1 Tax=Actinomadura rubrisoli TaxID=2530368 RepID=A0A4R5AD22_9ACTN|nr:SRPBCC family protein [Actinomadura rubrisoli]TDD70358.1 carbon monoxide dehydrogenase [Actinomadura rubrisoli]